MMLQGLALTAIGMSTVFFFLLVLVLLMNNLAALVTVASKFFPPPEEPIETRQDAADMAKVAAAVCIAAKYSK